MIKKELKNLDLFVYSEKLKNGLEVYIIPSTKVKNTYATYSSRYGGIHNTFTVSKETTTVPKGIAHFLEHKMFEEESGVDAFSYFSKNGSRANANTSARKTTYLFSGPNGFYDNLEKLLSYVESPYFTDENVEKEKGIIIEEIHMGDDKPFARMYKGSLYNSLVNHPMKYPVIGTDESVSSITKEMLYKCYNTFYHPSNMFLVITGNIDPVKTLDLIKKHEDKREVSKFNKITFPKVEEPDKVAKKKEVIKMPIGIPLISVAFKINIKKFKMPYNKIYGNIMNAFSLKLDSTSLFNERLIKEGLINEEVSLTGVDCDDHLLVLVAAETRYPDKVLKAILNELKDMTIREEDFERRKRTGISSLVMSSDNIFSVNSMIMGDIIRNKKIEYNRLKKIRKYRYSDAKKILSNIDLNNYTVFEIQPLKED